MVLSREKYLADARCETRTLLLKRKRKEKNVPKEVILRVVSNERVDVNVAHGVIQDAT